MPGSSKFVGESDEPRCLTQGVVEEQHFSHFAPLSYGKQVGGDRVGMSMSIRRGSVVTPDRCYRDALGQG